MAEEIVGGGVPDRIATPADVQAGAPQTRSTAQLVREALDETRALVRAELALARDEVRREVAKAKVTAAAIGLSLVLLGLTVVMLSISFAIYTFPRALPALIFGLVLLGVALVAGLVGYAVRPRKPLAEAKERLQTDVRVLKESMA
jgi:hypothetical protein